MRVEQKFWEHGGNGTSHPHSEPTTAPLDLVVGGEGTQMYTDLHVPQGPSPGHLGPHSGLWSGIGDTFTTFSELFFSPWAHLFVSALVRLSISLPREGAWHLSLGNLVEIPR